MSASLPGGKPQVLVQVYLYPHAQDHECFCLIFITTQDQRDFNVRGFLSLFG